jgi:ataxia telangiectasia mutated family protein
MNDASRFNLGIGIDMSSGSADEAADRALSSVARKLDRSLSVESTVNELLAEATDPMNLATIFYGKKKKLLCHCYVAIKTFIGWSAWM